MQIERIVNLYFAFFRYIDSREGGCSRCDNWCWSVFGSMSETSLAVFLFSPIPVHYSSSVHRCRYISFAIRGEGVKVT